MTAVAFQAIINEQTKFLIDDIKGLHDEIASQEAELSAACWHCASCSCDQSLSASATSLGIEIHTFADVVRNLVQSALQEEKSKNDVIKGLMENICDHDDLDSLCNKVKIYVKPTTVVRLGKTDAAHPIICFFSLLI